MLTYINLPFMTWKERELSIMFEKSECALDVFLSHQFHEVSGENMVHVGATILHYFVYFSV